MDKVTLTQSQITVFKAIDKATLANNTTLDIARATGLTPQRALAVAKQLERKSLVKGTKRRRFDKQKGFYSSAFFGGAGAVKRDYLVWEVTERGRTFISEPTVSNANKAALETLIFDIIDDIENKAQDATDALNEYMDDLREARTQAEISKIATRIERVKANWAGY